MLVLALAGMEQLHISVKSICVLVQIMGIVNNMRSVVLGNVAL